MIGALETNPTAGESIVPADETVTAPSVAAVEQVSDQTKGLVENMLDAVACSGPADQLRGYTNEAIGEARLNLGLAVGSPELALLGVAQKVLGQAQIYIGEAKMAVETEIENHDVQGPAACDQRQSGENISVDPGD